MSYIPLIARVNSLPPLPESVLKLEQIFNDKDPDIDDIVKIIESDPALTTDILAKANAPYYGFSRTIVDIIQAITLFGAPQIRSIVLSSSIERCFDIDLSPYNISTVEYSKISSMQSELAFQWYFSINPNIARELAPIAFLMEVGKILIAKDIIENDKSEDFIKDLEKYQDTSYVENLHAMMTTAQINAIIFKHLNLKDTFYESMKYLDGEVDAPQEMQEIVNALQIVRKAVNIEDQFSEDSIQNALEQISQSNIDEKHFLKITRRIKNKFNIDD
jgi:HD-like signal output (HDOD) protein